MSTIGERFQRMSWLSAVLVILMLAAIEASAAGEPGRINGGRLTVARYVLEGETHISVSHAALTRSLRFAFPYTSQ